MYINMAYIYDILTIVLVCFVSHVVSSVQHPHSHVQTEHTETDTLKFGYDPALHHLVAILSRTCFMAPLSHDERDHIQSTIGLEEMEMYGNANLTFELVSRNQLDNEYTMYKNLNDNRKDWYQDMLSGERVLLHGCQFYASPEMVKMMRDWIGHLPEVRIYHDDTHLPDNTKKWCANKDIFLLQRDVNVMTSPKSPLVTSSA